MIQNQPPSLARNSIARYVSDGVKVVFGFLSAIVTSRWLGPAGKGTLSTLLLIGVLLSYACSLGLGDAAVLLVKQKRASVSEALSASILPSLLTSFIGIGILWIVAWIADWREIGSAVLVASILLPIATLAYLLASFEEAAERLVVTSTVSAISTAIATLGTAIFIITFQFEILGGVIPTLIAAGFSVIALLSTLRSQGIHAAPGVNLKYLKTALPYGLVVEASFLLVSITSRADLLVVYGLLGEREAGWYAVALTLGELVAYAPDAVSAAAFPRVAGLFPHEVGTLGPRIFRIGIATAIAGAFLLTVGIPLVVPLAFGVRFEESIAPAIILAWGGVLWSAQWLLCRMGAARGYTRAYFASFVASATSMIGLDVLLLDDLGLIGAASISAVSSALGLCVAVYLLQGRLDFELSAANLWPRRGDFQELASVLRNRR